MPHFFTIVFNCVFALWPFLCANSSRRCESPIADDNIVSASVSHAVTSKANMPYFAFRSKRQEGAGRGRMREWWCRFRKRFPSQRKHRAVRLHAPIYWYTAAHVSPTSQVRVSRFCACASTSSSSSSSSSSYPIADSKGAYLRAWVDFAKQTRLGEKTKASTRMRGKPTKPYKTNLFI